MGENMRNIGKYFIALFLAVNLSACTYNIQPATPVLPPIADEASQQPCSVLLLIPQEFASREYVSSFEGREIRLLVGPPASAAIESLLRSSFMQVEKRNVTGDGTLDFVRLASVQQNDPRLIARPRFVRLESSVRPFRYNIEFGLALDIAGLSESLTLQGIGIGTAGLYVQSEIQNAADEALLKAITSLAESLPRTCK
ncbi:MAG: hypothetical protein PHH00_04185 [Candidatus Nanoarchaeia archaeon]|nr:hypothetical protein [Candidatus Nanoarchaeia archaeon]